MSSNRQYRVEHAPEFLQQMADHSAQVIVAAGQVDEATAIELGQQIAARMAQVFGGSRVSIPTGTWNGRAPFCFDLSKRDLAIYREFNGRNLHQVAEKNGIHWVRVYQIVKRVRAALKRPEPAPPPRVGVSAPADPAPAQAPALTPSARSV